MLEDEKKEVLEEEVKPEAAETPAEELGLPAEEAAAEAAAETPAEELGLPAEDPEIAELEARIEGALEEEGPSKEDIFLAEKEGEALKNNILIKLDEMDSHVAFIEEKLPLIIGEYKEKLEEKVKDFLANNPLMRE